MGKIVRILNHNAVIVHDAQDNRVLLLLDKGIGFGKKRIACRVFFPL